MPQQRKPQAPGKDWKRELNTILGAHQDERANGRTIAVSHRTRAARRAGLYHSFGLLRALGFKPAPANLSQRHVDALARFWTADPTLVPELRARGSSIKLPAQPYSAAYIQQQMSFLRVFAGWIGKPGMVRSAAHYADAALVTRRGNAERDLGWAAAGVDHAALLAQVTSLDPYVGVQLQVMQAFGLRRKEAVMFSLYLAQVLPADVPLDHLSQAASEIRYLSFLRIKRGTKGGRLRFTAIRNPEQVAALAAALALAGDREGAHIGRPGRSLKQALARFSYVLRKVGATRAMLGVTPHGLRHQFAGDLYFELTGVEAPARGGEPEHDPALRRAAYQEVALQLGHGRPRIAGAYLGARNHRAQE